MKLAHIALLLLLAAPALHAAEPADAEQRLREALKNTMLQLRAAQTERATLQANHLVDEAKIKELSTEIETLNKKIAKLTQDAADEQTAANQTIEALKAKEAQHEKQIAQLKESLEKWKSGYNEVVNIAKEREALRAKAASKAIVAERRLAERERQNLELYTTGREILDRLENFGLGTALTAREPFVGVTKVKLQNLVQDYGDKLQDNKYNPFDKDAKSASGPAKEEPAAAAQVEKPRRP
jgi:chromosome segregation ATPase